MDTSQNFENLKMAVIDNSKSKSWELAVQEWEIIECKIAKDEENEPVKTTCVCGKTHLKYLFTIKNKENDNILFPIGSTCINKFKRDDLDYEITVYEDMFKLIRAVESKKYIELNSNLFTRKLIKYLYDKDVFKPNKYNGYSKEADYLFMVDMFNKRNKDEIDELSQKKINAIMINAIIPFVRSKIKVNTNTVTPVCPRCGKPMVVRTAKQGRNAGKDFLGCSDYPNCRYTKNID